MGLNSTKSSLTNTKYSLTLSSPNNFYRGLSKIEGEFHLNIRTKLRIEKEIRIDFIGQLIEKKRGSSKSSSQNQIFFTYSSPLVTSHQNGTARTIKNQQMTYPFRIPLGMHLPPSCEFKEFSIVYYLDIYHDGRLLPNVHKNIILAPPAPHINIPLPCEGTGFDDITMVCSLQKSFYSGRDGAFVPISISVKNPKEKQIKSVTVQFMQIVSLNEIKHENEIFTRALNEIIENPLNTTFELVLPSNLTPTYIPNENGQPDNVPSVAIIYEFRILVQIKGVTTSDLRLSVPIGIE